jgi:hypothetical protein
MDKDNQLSFEFKMISGTRVTADFTGGEVTSDGGVLLVREIADRIGIIDRLTDAIVDTRHQSYVRHDIKSLLAQRIFQIACGYEDADDADDLRTDPGFKASCGRLPSEADLASQPTMSRFENTLTSKDIHRIAGVLIDQFISSYDTPPEAIILDIDDTDDPTHGAQQLSLFNGYHDEYCYMPLFIFEGMSGRLITGILRPGKRPTGKEVRSIIKRIVNRIRTVWPSVGILVRGDSHYATPELYAWSGSHDVQYILGLATNAVLKVLAQPALAAARREYELTGTPSRVFRQIRYQAKSWHKDHRVIVMAEVSERGDNLRFIVTSLESSRPSFLYQTVYCGRGRMENFIKEHKVALKSGRTSCHRYMANFFRLTLHSAAYVILHTLRRIALADTDFATAQFDTIRLRLLKIGAEVREMKTKLHFILPSSFPLKDVFATIHTRIVLLR